MLNSKEVHVVTITFEGEPAVVLGQTEAGRYIRRTAQNVSDQGVIIDHNGDVVGNAKKEVLRGRAKLELVPLEQGQEYADLIPLNDKRLVIQGDNNIVQSLINWARGVLNIGGR